MIGIRYSNQEDANLVALVWIAAAFEVGPLSNSAVPETATNLLSSTEGNRHYFCFEDEPEPEPH